MLILVADFKYKKYMKSITLLFIFFLLLTGCQSNEKPLHDEIEFLKQRNDSLVGILKEIESKYVFDSISFREIPNPENGRNLNDNYGLELLVVGYSANKDYFIKFDSIINNKLVNPDTLKQRNGGFKFNMKLDKMRNPIKIKMNIENKYGKSKKGKLYDIIRVNEK